MSFWSPLIARLDTLCRQRTNLFIKSGALNHLSRLRFHHDLTHVAIKHRRQETDIFILGSNKTSDRVPGIKRSPPPLIACRDTLRCFVVRSESIPLRSCGSVSWFRPLAVALFIFAKLEGFFQLSILSGHSVESSCEGAWGEGYYSKTQQDSATERRTPRISRSFDSVEWSNTKRQETKRQADIWLLCSVLFFLPRYITHKCFHLILIMQGP